jgi:hypothetical protein
LPKNNGIFWKLQKNNVFPFLLIAVENMPLFPTGFEGSTIDGYPKDTKAANFSNYRAEFSVPGQQYYDN